MKEFNLVVVEGNPRVEILREFEFEAQVVSPRIGAELFRAFEIEKQAEECLYVACLNAQSMPLGVSMVSRGTIDGTFASPRDILKRALLLNAPRIIIAHNHPSGVVTPSKQDLESYQTLKKACELMGVELLDSIIVAGSQFLSLRDVCK